MLHQNIISIVWNGIVKPSTYADDKLVHEFINGTNKPFNHEHYLLLNIAIGGNLGEELPDDFTDATFEIDCVRVLAPNKIGVKF